jgi:hypothetical protein
MILELILQGIFRYREFLILAFPYVCLALAIVTDEKIKSFFIFLIISGIILSFVPTLENIQEARYLSRQEELSAKADVINFCQSSVKKVRRK